MVYPENFTLVGNEQQQAIVADALNRIKFPWQVLKAPTGSFIIGWTDLNNGSFSIYSKHHSGHKPGEPFAVEKKINGRNYILGVFYPSTGDSWIDYALVDYPELAKTTVSAELAHLVDFFLPLTDEQKRELVALMHGDEPHSHDPAEWWEVHDYGKEYNNLPGESFMQLFTLAYSDLAFDASQFSHSITKEEAPKVRGILGIERTDFVPAPEPAKPKEYIHFRGSNVYHTKDHYKRQDKDKELIKESDPAIGVLRPCRVCRPK